MQKLKELPTFKNEADESLFWDENDITDYFDTSKVKSARFPNLKKTTKSISLRLPVDMIEELKVKANAMDVPYQSLIKMFLSDALKSAWLYIDIKYEFQITVMCRVLKADKASYYHWIKQGCKVQ